MTSDFVGTIRSERIIVHPRIMEGQAFIANLQKQIAVHGPSSEPTYSGPML